MLQSWNLILGMPLIQIEMRFRFITMLEGIVPNSDLVIFFYYLVYFINSSPRDLASYSYGVSLTFSKFKKKKKKYMFSVIQTKMSAWEEAGMAGYHT